MRALAHVDQLPYAGDVDVLRQLSPLAALEESVYLARQLLITSRV